MKKKTRIPTGKAVSAAVLDAMHDAGVDLSQHMDKKSAQRPGRAQRGVRRIVTRVQEH